MLLLIGLLFGQAHKQIIECISRISPLQPACCLRSGSQQQLPPSLHGTHTHCYQLVQSPALNFASGFSSEFWVRHMQQWMLALPSLKVPTLLMIRPPLHQIFQHRVSTAVLLTHPCQPPEAPKSHISSCQPHIKCTLPPKKMSEQLLSYLKHTCSCWTGNN